MLADLAPEVELEFDESSIFHLFWRLRRRSPWGKPIPADSLMLYLERVGYSPVGVMFDVFSDLDDRVIEGMREQDQRQIEASKRQQKARR